MVPYRTDEELQAGLRKWQRILHLEDWEITALLVPQPTLGDHRLRSGDCAVQTYYLQARIRLATLDTLDLVIASDQQDMERTLVHELMHVVFRAAALWDWDYANVPKHLDRHYECAIEQTARALVELDRRGAANVP